MAAAEVRSGGTARRSALEMRKKNHIAYDYFSVLMTFFLLMIWFFILFYSYQRLGYIKSL